MLGRQIVGCSLSAEMIIFQRWSEKWQTTNQWQGVRRQGHIDAQGQRRLSHVVWANRRSTVAQVIQMMVMGGMCHKTKCIALYCIAANQTEFLWHTSVHRQKHLWANDCRNWSSGRRSPGRMCTCALFTQGSDGTMMQCGMMTSQWRECDALGNALLGNTGSSHSCGRKFDTCYQPKQCRPGTPLHDSGVPWWKLPLSAG